MFAACLQHLKGPFWGVRNEGFPLFNICNIREFGPFIPLSPFAHFCRSRISGGSPKKLTISEISISKSCAAASRAVFLVKGRRERFASLSLKDPLAVLNSSDG